MSSSEESSDSFSKAASVLYGAGAHLVARSLGGMEEILAAFSSRASAS